MGKDKKKSSVMKSVKSWKLVNSIFYLLRCNEDSYKDLMVMSLQSVDNLKCALMNTEDQDGIGHQVIRNELPPCLGFALLSFL